MPKICEICKQPYDDKLTSCPNCDIVDIFGSSTPTAPIQGAGPRAEDSAAVALGGDPLEISGTPTVTPKSGQPLPATKVQGPLPPVGSVVGPPSMKGKTPAPPVPPTGSPLMARAIDSTKPAGTAPAAGKPSVPTMVAPQQNQPTMIAPQHGQPTMVAKGGAAPTQIAKSSAPPTMIAPESLLSGSEAPTAPLPPAAASSGPPPAAGKGAPVTMLPRGAAQPTMMAKTTSPPTMMMPPTEPLLELPPEGEATTQQLPPGAAGSGPKKTVIPAQAKQPTMLQKPAGLTQLAPEGTEALPTDAGDPADVSKKKTQLPQGAKMPTMLAKGGAKTELEPEGTAPLDIPGNPKKTMLAKPGGPKTVLEKEDTAPMELPEGADKKKTMVARPGGPKTVLEKEGTAPMELPGGSLKKTMLPKPPNPTVMAPEGEQPMELPGGGPKKTVLPGVAKKTTLDTAEPMDLPGGNKKTMLAGGMRPMTTLNPPDEAEPMELPGGVRSSLSGEMAAMELETAPAADLSGMDSAAKYDTAPPVQPGYKKRWFGGMVLGFLLTLGVLAALWAFREQEPVEGWLAALGLRPIREKSDNPVRDALLWLDEGKVDAAFLVIEKAGDEPDVQGVRGEARWFRYLQNKGAAGDINAGEVQTALRELEEARKGTNDDLKRRAAIWPGHIEERLGTQDKALKLFADGRDKFKEAAEPFKAGSDRTKGFPVKAAKAPPAEKLEKVKPAEKKDKDEGEKGAMARPSEMETLELLALFLTAQQGGALPPDIVKLIKTQPEAGSAFWEAVRLYSEGNYGTAVKKLQEARDQHSKLRFTRLKKAQNPLTDPTEEIFLKSVEDLAILWQIAQMLEPLKKSNPGKSLLELAEIAAKSATVPGGKELEEIAKALGVPNNRGEVLKAILDLGEAKKIADIVKKDLKDGNYVTEDQPDVEKGTLALVADAKDKREIGKLIKDTDKKDEPNTVKAAKEIIDDRADLIDTVTKGSKKLADANYMNDAKYEKEKFLKGIDAAIEAAMSPLVAALGRTLSELAKLSGQAPIAGSPATVLAGKLGEANLKIEVLEGRLKSARTARQMLEIYLPILVNKELKEVKDITDWAAQDARHVLDDKLATPSEKAAALAIQGLANRHTANFDDARKALTEAVKTAPAAGEGSWRKPAAEAVKELTDPTAYYLPRTEELASYGMYSKGLDIVNSGIGAFPAEGKLLALRSQIKVDQARAKTRGPLTLRNPVIAEARKDADAAIAAGALGEGNYALGLVLENIGDPVAAEQAYRKALAANPAANFPGSRYRIALGRVILRINPLPGGQPAIAPLPGAERPPVNNNKVGLLTEQEQQELRTTLALTLVGLQAPADDETPDLDEVIRLADQAIRAKNYEGYLIKAGALARKGQWTEALKTYTEGLRYLSRYGEGLAEIVNNHPAFNLPDPLRNPDPLRAERHFSNGLRLYYQGAYPQAEAEFLEAYRNQGQDARILYFLGLSRLPQGKQDAAKVNFQMGSILEQQSKPGAASVNASLERVQGELRRYINQFRP